MLKIILFATSLLVGTASFSQQSPIKKGRSKHMQHAQSPQTQAVKVAGMTCFPSMDSLPEPIKPEQMKAKPGKAGPAVARVAPSYASAPPMSLDANRTVQPRWLPAILLDAPSERASSDQ